MILQIAEEQKAGGKNPLAVKKMFVLAGLLVEQHHTALQLTQRAKGKDKKVSCMIEAQVGIAILNWIYPLSVKIITRLPRSGPLTNEPTPVE